MFWANLFCSHETDCSREKVEDRALKRTEGVYYCSLIWLRSMQCNILSQARKTTFSIFCHVLTLPSMSDIDTYGKCIPFTTMYIQCTYHNHILWYLILRSTQEYLEKSVLPYWEMAGGGLVWIPWLPQFNTMLSCALGRWLCMNYNIFEHKEASYAMTRIVRQD